MPTPRGDLRRQQIVDAALAEIRTQAVADVQLSAIAERAGMKASHVLYYFGSRDDVLIAAVAHAEQQLATDRAERLRAIDDPIERLAAFVGTYLPDDRHDPVWKLWIEGWLRSPSRTEFAPVGRKADQGWMADVAGLPRARHRARRHAPRARAVVRAAVLCSCSTGSPSTSSPTTSTPPTRPGSRWRRCARSWGEAEDARRARGGRAGRGLLAQLDARQARRVAGRARRVLADDRRQRPVERGPVEHRPARDARRRPPGLAPGRVLRPQPGGVLRRARRTTASPTPR